MPNKLQELREREIEITKSVHIRKRNCECCKNTEKALRLLDDTRLAGQSRFQEHLQRVREDLRFQLTRLSPMDGELETYLEIIKTGDLEKMFDFGYRRAIEDVSKMPSLSTKEATNKE